MTFPSFLSQLWRAVRLGGVAALATTQAASQVKGTVDKTAVTAGALAFAEVVYRQLVPAKEVTQLARYWTAVKTVATSPAVSALASPQLSKAEKAIAAAGIKPPTTGQ